MNKKVAIITGATGGVGGGFVQLLSSLGWVLYTPVRSLNENAKALATLPGVIVEIVEQDNTLSVKKYLQQLHEKGVFPTLIVLAAGGRGPRGEFYDTEFPGETLKEQQETAAKEHVASSVTTKKVFLEQLAWIYSDADLKKMTLVVIGSHAESFSLEEQLKFHEVGYAEGMRLIGPVFNRFAHFFARAFHLKPGLIRTTLTKEKLADALADPTREVKEPDSYAKEVMTETGLI